MPKFTELHDLPITIVIRRNRVFVIGVLLKRAPARAAAPPQTRAAPRAPGGGARARAALA
jgi:hypothetical protein